jgi:hypothetical protein
MTSRSAASTVRINVRINSPLAEGVSVISFSQIGGVGQPSDDGVIQPTGALWADKPIYVRQLAVGAMSAFMIRPARSASKAERVSCSGVMTLVRSATTSCPVASRSIARSNSSV